MLPPNKAPLGAFSRGALICKIKLLAGGLLDDLQHKNLVLDLQHCFSREEGFQFSKEIVCIK